MISRLGEVSRSMDPSVLDELAGHAEALLTAWRSVAEGDAGGAADPSGVAPPERESSVMNVNPVGGVHPAFGTWLERRRQRMEAQMSAIEEERYHDLVDLLDSEQDDRPPQPRSDREREQYRQMLRDQEKLAVRLVQVRRRLLGELRDVERKQASASLEARSRSSLGGSLDGYL